MCLLIKYHRHEGIHVKSLSLAFIRNEEEEEPHGPQGGQRPDIISDRGRSV